MTRADARAVAAPRSPATHAPPTAEPPGRCPWWQPVALAVVTLIVFGSALDHVWVSDAQLVIRDDVAVRTHDWRAILTTDWWSGSGDGRGAGLYRPVARAWVALLVPGPESGPALVNAGNILLQFLLAWLRLALLRRLLPPRAGVWAFVAALAALLHPSAAEVVGSQVGAADALGACGMTAALLVAGGPGLRRSACAGALAALAILAKESAIAVVVVAPAVAWAATGGLDARAVRRAIGRALVWSTAGAAAALGLRFAMIPVGGVSPDAVLAGFPLIARLATACAAFSTWTIPLLLGARASLPAITLQDSPPADGFGDARALAGLALLAVLIAVPIRAWRRRAPLGMVAVALLLAPLVVVSNIPILIGAIAASRFVYPSVPGVVLAIAALAARATGAPSLRRAAQTVLLGVVACWGWQTLAELPIWHDQLALFEAGFARAPASAFATTNLAVEIEAVDAARARRLFEAATASTRATIPGTQLYPEFATYLMWDAAMRQARLLGDTFHDLAGAAQSLDRAGLFARQGIDTARATHSTKLPWGSHLAAVNRYRALLSLGERAASKDPVTRAAALAEAHRWCDAMTAAAPGEPQGVALLSQILRAEGKHAEARQVLATSLRDHPDDPDLLLEDADGLREAGRNADALPVELRALMRQGAQADSVRCLRVGGEASAAADPVSRASGRSLLVRLVQRGAATGDERARQVATEARRLLTGRPPPPAPPATH